MSRLVCLLLVAGALVACGVAGALSAGGEPESRPELQSEPGEDAGKPRSIERTRGALRVSFEDNVNRLAGIRLLRHESKPDLEVLVGAVNYEHVISGAPDFRNKFTPRHGPLELRGHPHGASLHRRAEDSPWKVAAVLTFTLVEPHFVDFEFEATITDASQFSKDEVTFFFASYMKSPEQYEIRFKGIPAEGEPEQWVESKPNGTKSTNYAAAGAPDLARHRSDAWHDLHLRREPFPQITQPYYYGRAAGGMVYAVMFDRLLTKDEEMRFCVFRWTKGRPAWDFEYVARNLTDGKKVGFKGRLVYKPLTSADEIAAIYREWSEKNR